VSVEEALGAFIDELRGRLGSRLARVVLFGSYAKGCADERSDVDVLVVYVNAEPGEAARLVAEAAARVALKYGVPLEPVVMSLHEYLEKSPFTYEVERTGRVLYSADPGQEARELAYDYLRLAAAWLQHAREIHGEGRDPRFVVDAAYNAAELAVRALVVLRGETLAKTHGGLLSQFGRLYVHGGAVPHETLSRLYYALTLRNRARYDPRATLTEREAAEVIELAEELVEMLRGAIGEGEKPVGAGVTGALGAREED